MSEKKTASASSRARPRTAKKAVAKSGVAVRTASTERPGDVAAAERISARIGELADWRGAMLARVREFIRKADADIVEEWKWNVPVWSHSGIICTGETYRNVVKLTFAKGALLQDPSGLFNSSLTGNTRRAIDIHEHETIDGRALQRLIRNAVALNVATSKKRA